MEKWKKSYSFCIFTSPLLPNLLRLTLLPLLPLPQTCLFQLNFFPVPQTALQDCGKQYLPVFDVVLGGRVGFVPFMEIGCINPLLAAR
jgi:hypothetical protein